MVHIKEESWRGPGMGSTAPDISNRPRSLSSLLQDQGQSTEVVVHLHSFIQQTFTGSLL